MYDFASYDTPETAWRYTAQIVHLKHRQEGLWGAWCEAYDQIQKLSRNPPDVANRARLDRLLAQEIGG